MSNYQYAPQLVEEHNGQPMTTSLLVAQFFNKRHADVLRSIQNLECSGDFAQRNFAFCSYRDSNNREREMYRMTRDGFSYLCMGFTGKIAARWKEQFINAFNQLESLASQPLEERYDRKAITQALLAEIEKNEQLALVAHEAQVGKGFHDTLTEDGTLIKPSQIIGYFPGLTWAQIRAVLLKHKLLKWVYLTPEVRRAIPSPTLDSGLIEWTNRPALQWAFTHPAIKYLEGILAQEGLIDVQ